MLVLLAAWLFWLMLNGRLGLYAGFASQTSSGGASPLGAFSIPVKVTLVANNPFQMTATPGGNAGGSAAPKSGMPLLSNYLTNMPASDTGIYGAIYGAVNGGFYPSGLPSYGTLEGINNEALANVAGGAAGL